MKSTNLKKGPHKIALELIDRFLNLKELWLHLNENVSLEEWEKLYSAADPEYEQNQKKQKYLYKKIEQALPSEEARKALVEYSNSCVDEVGIKEVAYFILGVAMGQRLSSPRFG